MENKIKQNTIVEQVMERIKVLIASGQYKVGDKLPTESQLGEMFGIGRSSVREAIKIFNYLGILESRTAKGTYVCSRSQISSEALSWAVLLGSEEIGELLETRAAIELWSMLQLAGNYKSQPEKYQSYLDEMRQTIADMRAAVQEKPGQTMSLDFRFHDIMISSSENSLFISIYHTLRSFTMSSSTKVHQDSGILRTLPEIHENLLQAILKNDRVTIMREMQQHIQITKDKLFTSIAKSNHGD